MLTKKFLFVVLLCGGYHSGESTGVRHDPRAFPEDFMFGVATASYQVEGAWDADGKTENIWDHLTHTEPCAIKDCSNGDVATNAYNKVERDVEMLRELGVDSYRFSLSWARILPSSFPDQINEAGIQYYNNLIDEMLKYNIKPMITLYHWDLPQKLQDLGGWANPHIVDWFGDYARICFELFGDRVKNWITINEPREICYQGYGEVLKAPRVNIKGIGEYMCAKNILVAHARAYHIYDTEFRPTIGGEIGITINAQWYEPESEKDSVAAKEMRDFHNGQYIHPIFSDAGDFPVSMKTRIAAKSEEQGFLRSRLPEFTPEEVDYVRSSSDFLGINHYTSYYLYRNESVEGAYEVPSYFDDVGVIRYQSSEWQSSATEWLKVVPWGFYKLLTELREYNNPKIYITENGISSTGGLDDDYRVEYFKSYMEQMLNAMDEGTNVRAFFAWSLMDNFEWMQGYTERFGLYQVDYESEDRTRTPRKSAFFFKQTVRTRALDMHYEPDTDVMTIDEGH